MTANQYDKNITCKRCNKTKLAGEFQDSVHCKSGKRSVCLNCVRLQSRKSKLRCKEERLQNGTKQEATLQSQAAMQPSQETTTTTSQFKEKEVFEEKAF